MLVTKSWIQKNYQKFNNLFWNGNLPNIEFKISRSRKTWGYAAYNYDYYNSTIYPVSITMSNYYDSPEQVKQQTLLHEMIHIADYTFHPEHFIKNGRRISRRYYDAHGWWFKTEANRIYDESNHMYKIAPKVTTEERGCSKLSEVSQKQYNRKIEHALIGAVYGNNDRVFFFRTSEANVSYIKNYTIKRYGFHHLDGIKTVKFYSFDKRYVNNRACRNHLTGWTMSLSSFKNELKEINAVEVKF